MIFEVGTGVGGTEKWLRDVREGVIRPISQTETRAVTSLLKEVGQREPAIAAMMAGEERVRGFVIAALTLSPYLRDVTAADPQALALALEAPLNLSIRQGIHAARESWRPVSGASAPGESEVMARLRTVKRRVSYLCALADLARIFDARETTRWLSLLADASVAATVDHLLLAGHETGKVQLKNPQVPAEGSGVVVLGMGKLGAFELNYSSDIDIVVFFEPMAGILPDPDDGAEVLGRMMRRLVRIMQDRTGDGYVFRTDLRLRPDPGSTPLAIPVEAALLYYEGRGQNWERAAFIKARPIAGDIVAGEGFLKELTPFVFRKYLDYAAIADIHSIKRQIHAHKGHGAIAVKGHNVKLGRGGIREIEFFAQTQQLIAGGRMPPLRVRPTEAALVALEQAGWIDAETRDDLVRCYWFLRDVEHRIQMVRDEQTHILPDTESELKRIAYMLGFADTASFSSALEDVLRNVERRYARLFEQETKLSAGDGNLVFTGQKDDPGTLTTLKNMGFTRPEATSSVMRTWHNGRYRATRSVEARERLTELTPELLRVFGQSRQADDALLRFDSFLSGLPAGIQLFSLLGNNPALLALLVNIMSAAPRLADTIAKRPHVFDGMLDPGLMAELPTRDYLAGRLDQFLAGATHYEEVLDRLRIFAAEQRFLIGIRLLTGAIGGTVAGRAFTHLADLVIAAAFAAVLREMREAHGNLPGGRVVVMGMGKLGSFELTAGSDVDLIVLYDHEGNGHESDGAKPLDCVRYFTRLTQRLIAALSAPTAEGVLYEVDMRLRPSGNKGPVATRISAFTKYQKEEAWTWEHMALTRARIICGDPSLADDAGRVISDVLSTRRERAKVAADVAEMRAMIEKEKPSRDLWDFKLIPGGIIDIEFIAQYLALTSPERQAGCGVTTAEALKFHGQERLGAEDIETCLAALSLYCDLSQIIRLCIDGPFVPKEAPSGLIDRLTAAADMPAIKPLEAEISRLSKAVRRVFQALLK